MCPSTKLRVSRLFAMMVRKPQPVCQSNSALCAAVSSGSCTCAQGPLPRPACRHIKITTAYDIIARHMFDDMFVYESGLRRRDGRRPLCIRIPKIIKEAETLRCRRQLEGGILCSRYVQRGEGTILWSGRVYDAAISGAGLEFFSWWAWIGSRHFRSGGRGAWF